MGHGVVDEEIGTTPTDTATTSDAEVDIKSFVGRGDLIASTTRRLLSGRARLVTYKGPGGVGKTALAQQTVLALDGELGSVVTVVLTDVGTAVAELEGALAKAFNIPDNNPDIPTVVGLMSELQRREPLLVLDNCEHLVGTADEPGPLPALLRRLLKSVPGLRVLATSRLVIGLTGVEHPVDVPPLACTAPAGTKEWPEAVQLLRDRVEVLGRPLDDAQLPLARQLCLRVDGLPRAIETLAKLRYAMSWQEMLERIDEDPLELLQEEEAAHPHQRSMWKSMLLSYMRLPEPLQPLWIVLSVFPGYFDRDAADNVCKATGIEADAMANRLVTLVHHSVLERSELDGRTWYRMLETTGAFGRAVARRSELSELVDLSRRAHADYYAGLSRRAADEWYGPDEIVWMRTLGRAMTNLRAAVKFLIESGQWERALEAWLNVLRTRYNTFAGTLNDVRRLLDTCLDAAGSASSVLVVSGLAMGAWTALIQGKTETAKSLLERCDQLMRQLDQATPAPGVLRFAELSYLWLTEEDETKARQSVQAMLGLAAEEPHPGDRTMVWLFAVMDAGFLGTKHTAFEAARAHLADTERQQAPWAFSWALWGLALVELRHGDAGKLDRALKLLQRALEIQRREDDTWGIVWTFWLIAVVVAFGGYHTVAAQMFGGAWTRQRNTVDVNVDGLAPFRRVQKIAVQACSAALGGGLFQVEVATGGAMTLDELADLAMELSSPGARFEIETRPNGLTEREFETLMLLKANPKISNSQLADALHVSVRTIEGYMERARQKLGVRNRHGLAAWMTEWERELHPAPPGAGPNDAG